MLNALRVARQTTQADIPTYVEFGCGGSTRIAATLAAQPGKPIRIIAFDSSKEWLQDLGQDPALKPLRDRPDTKDLSNPIIQLLHADIGPLAGWGTPKENSSRHT